MNDERKKIILIEDGPDHADLITEVLVKGGLQAEIILIQDGMEAVDYFQEPVIKWNGYTQVLKKEFKV